MLDTKAKGGWEIRCLPVEVARELTRNNIDDRMWADKAESKGKWVRVRRPRNKPYLPFQAFSLCDTGGRRSRTDNVIRFPGRRTKRKKHT